MLALGWEHFAALKYKFLSSFQKAVSYSYHKQSWAINIPIFKAFLAQSKDQGGGNIVSRQEQGGGNCPHNTDEDITF